MSKWGLCFFFFFSSPFLYFFFLPYRWQSGALIRYKYLLKKYFKAIANIIQRVCSALHARRIILCFYPKRCIACGGRRDERAADESSGWAARKENGCAPAYVCACSARVYGDGRQRNYIGSSRRLYYTYTYTRDGLSRITDALTSIGEIFYLLPLCPPPNRCNITLRARTVPIAVHYYAVVVYTILTLSIFRFISQRNRTVCSGGTYTMPKIIGVRTDVSRRLHNSFSSSLNPITQPIKVPSASQ